MAILYYMICSMSIVFATILLYVVIFMNTVQKSYEVFADLLAKKKVTPYRVYKETGVPQSSLSEWKRGNSMPKIDKMQKLAEYFGVSVDYILTGDISDQKETPALNKKDERDIARKLEETLDMLNNNQDGLMFDGEPLDEETQELLRASLKNQFEVTKKLAKQKYTPNKYRK